MDWSNISCSTILTSLHDLRVKVLALEFLCESFALKCLGPHYYPFDRLSFFSGMKIYIARKFYTVPSLPPTWPQDLNLYAKLMLKSHSVRTSFPDNSSYSFDRITLNFVDSKIMMCYSTYSFEVTVHKIHTHTYIHTHTHIMQVDCVFISVEPEIAW